VHLDSFRRWVLTIGKEAKIGENVIDEANLSEHYAINEVGHEVDILVNVNAKIICNRTLIFKHKVSVKAGNGHINHGIVDGKNQQSSVYRAMIQSLQMNKQRSLID